MKKLCYILLCALLCTPLATSAAEKGSDRKLLIAAFVTAGVIGGAVAGGLVSRTMNKALEDCLMKKRIWVGEHQKDNENPDQNQEGNKEENEQIEQLKEFVNENTAAIEDNSVAIEALQELIGAATPIDNMPSILDMIGEQKSKLTALEGRLLQSDEAPQLRASSSQSSLQLSLPSQRRSSSSDRPTAQEYPRGGSSH